MIIWTDEREFVEQSSAEQYLEEKRLPMMGVLLTLLIVAIPVDVLLIRWFIHWLR